MSTANHNAGNRSHDRQFLHHETTREDRIPCRVPDSQISVDFVNISQNLQIGFLDKKDEFGAIPDRFVKYRAEISSILL